jgi:hypothetical protein
MKYYSTFDSKVQCEENNQVSPEEYDEVMVLMAQESEAQEGFGNWSDEAELEQAAFEQKQSREKDWLNNYSPIDDGDSYAGIAI